MLKSKLNAYARLLDLLSNAEEELGLKNLTQIDKIVFTELIKNSDDNNKVRLTYKEIKNSISRNNISISRSQFFKSLSRLKNKNIIYKEDESRSSTFKLKISY